MGIVDEVEGAGQRMGGGEQALGLCAGAVRTHVEDRERRWNGHVGRYGSAGCHLPDREGAGAHELGMEDQAGSELAGETLVEERGGPGSQRGDGTPVAGHPHHASGLALGQIVVAGVAVDRDGAEVGRSCIGEHRGNRSASGHPEQGGWESVARSSHHQIGTIVVQDDVLQEVGARLGRGYGERFLNRAARVDEQQGGREHGGTHDGNARGIVDIHGSSPDLVVHGKRRTQKHRARQAVRVHPGHERVGRG